MIKTLKFWAPWCKPCTVLSKQLEGLEVENINIDEEDSFGLIREYKVRTVPTLIFTKDDAEVHRVSGVISKEEYLNLCNSLIEQK